MSEWVIGIHVCLCLGIVTCPPQAGGEDPVFNLRLEETSPNQNSSSSFRRRSTAVGHSLRISRFPEVSEESVNFVSEVTGRSRTNARRLLLMCGGDVNSAINRSLDVCMMNDDGPTFLSLSISLYVMMFSGLVFRQGADECTCV